MDKTQIINIIQEAFSSMYRSGVIGVEITVDKDTILIGKGSVLDSIAFVTLFVDIEDRLREKTGKEIYLVLDEIHDFNPENAYLTVGVLVDYIEKLAEVR